MTTRALRWIPNALSISRGILAVPIYMAATNQAWALGVWLIIIALMTDFFDGLAAKKFNAMSKLGGHFDRVADFTLSVAGVMGLIVGAHMLTLWILVFALPASLFVGYVKFFVDEDSKLYEVTSIFSITMLFVCWTFIVWGYLGQAYGWSWWYPPITILLIATAARLKRHRLRAWFRLLLENRKESKRF